MSPNRGWELLTFLVSWDTCLTARKAVLTAPHPLATLSMSENLTEVYNKRTKILSYMTLLKRIHIIHPFLCRLCVCSWPCPFSWMCLIIFLSSGATTIRSLVLVRFNSFYQTKTVAFPCALNQPGLVIKGDPFFDQFVSWAIRSCHKA